MVKQYAMPFLGNSGKRRLLLALPGRGDAVPRVRHDGRAGHGLTLADLALCGHSHGAGARGGFGMRRFPAINRWLAHMSRGARDRLRDDPCACPVFPGGGMQA